LNQSHPLTGIRVLELARVLAGPWAGQLLADLGADVIKVESPKGDETRAWGPPFHGDDSSAYFQSTNRGKKSIVADLRKSSDLNFVKDLASRADIIIENFKVGGLTKYKLDFQSIKKINPGLIYCSITGFGQSGPYAKRPGYDFIIQAMGGIMDLTGEPTSEPQKPGVAYADLFTGLYSVVAIQSALIARQVNGVGTHIDMSLFDTQLGVLANQGASFLKTGISPKRMGNMHPVIVPYQKFETMGGPIIIACGNDVQFKNLCLEFNWSFHNKKEYSTNRNRVLNRNKLIPLIQKYLLNLSKEIVLSKLETAGVPNGPINTVGEALTEPQANFRNIVKKIDGISTVRTPIIFDSLSLKYKHVAPSLGQHTTEIKNKIKNTNFWKKSVEIQKSRQFKPKSK
jgi:crotonobetainyl-CoA:carnitine CoA-transferase CaiB-like acyl-CoA transferase